MFFYKILYFFTPKPFFAFFQIFPPTPAFPPHFALPNSKIKKNGNNYHSLLHSCHPAKHLCHLFRKIHLLGPIITPISRSCKKLVVPYIPTAPNFSVFAVLKRPVSPSHLPIAHSLSIRPALHAPYSLFTPTHFSATFSFYNYFTPPSQPQSTISHPHSKITPFFIFSAVNWGNHYIRSIDLLPPPML